MYTIQEDPYMHLDIYSHFIKISKVTPRVRGLIYRFLTKYTQTVFSQKGGRTVKEDGKIFASQTKQHDEFRIHVGQYEDFLFMLSLNHIEPHHYTVTKRAIYTPNKIKIQVREGWALRDKQIDARDFILKEDETSRNSKFLAMPTGSGKFQPLYSKIKVPGGWSNMGNMKPGTIVIAPDGTKTTVTNIYPQGLQDIYEIETTDGRRTRAGLDHLWNVYTYQGESKLTWKVITTGDMIKLKDSKDIDSYLQLITPEESEDVSLDIEPYRLGRDISLYGDQTVPTAYLESSKKQRLAFIEGLMSGHGTELDGTYTLKVTKHQQVLILQKLVWSLGGTAHLSNIPGKVTVYNLSIKFNSKESSDLDYPGQLKLRVKSIKYIGKEECQCIEVDHPDHLYITDDFIVTHNTVTSLITVVEDTTRTIIAVLPKYMDKWLGDCGQIMDVTPKDIMQVAGAGQLKGIIQLFKDNKEDLSKMPKYIVVSLTTIQNFFKAYEEDRFSDEFLDYGCYPEEFCELLDIGNIIVDESHEHIYSVFRLMLFTNVPKIIGLSGTLITEDPFIKKIHEIMFPVERRYSDIKMKKYIKVYPISYSFNDFFAAKIQTTERGSNSYSHNAFEKSILRNRTLTKNYLDMIGGLTKLAYIDVKQDGDKLAVYASSIAMCTEITNYLKTKYPHLDVRRYVEDDPYENVIVADIRVSTIQSSGTAIDIPGLTVIVSTVSIASPVSNHQLLGRLREIKDRDVRFFYIFSADIKKQVEYHRKRMEMYADRVASIKELKSPYSV